MLDPCTNLKKKQMEIMLPRQRDLKTQGKKFTSTFIVKRSSFPELFGVHVVDLELACIKPLGLLGSQLLMK
jgi:hypothetical protein